MSGTTALPQEGFELLVEFEGGRSADGLYHAYWDSYGRVETIGVGQTRNRDGSAIRPGQVWTPAEAYADCRDQFAAHYAPSLNALGVPLNPHQFSGYGSFVWNLGPGSMQWDVGRYLRERNYQAAADALLQYDHAGGVRLEGLTRRRHAERARVLMPWVEPDPHRYLWFDDVNRKVSGHERHVRHANERQTVQEYDRLRATPRRYGRRLRRLRDNLSVLAARLENVIEADGGASNYRRWRLGQLKGRETGRRYV